MKGKSVLTIAQEIINKEKNLSKLASKSLDSLTKEAGIGKDKAATLLAAFEMSRRIQSQSKLFSSNKITSPGDVAEIFIPILRDELKEKFIVVCLNSANKIIKNEILKILPGSEVLLFGSRVRSDGDNLGDYDILVTVEANLEQHEKISYSIPRQKVSAYSPR